MRYRGLILMIPLLLLAARAFAKEDSIKIITVYRDDFTRESLKPRVTIMNTDSVPLHVYMTTKYADNVKSWYMEATERLYDAYILKAELKGYETTYETISIQKEDRKRKVKELLGLLMQRSVTQLKEVAVEASKANIRGYRERLMEINKQTNTVSVIAAGWDPGSDSIVRTLMQSLAPKGLSYTNFGPGMSMGHSVCVRSKAGVKNALSMTIPLGEGIHRRMVYVELEDGFTLEQVTKDIKADPYFANDETHVFQVESVDDVRDMGHGVNLVRKGVSGQTQNQRMEFNMQINNPALTGQVLVNVARASMRLQPGCYTMIEIPVIDMLPGDRADLIEHLV